MTTQTAATFTEITCAFCGGKGKDPFGVFSSLSECCVCGGMGANPVEEPYVQCAFCKGTGVYPRSRLTCTACGGLGVHVVTERTKTCPNCLGHGAEPASESGFYCLVCHGAGIVEGTAQSRQGHTGAS